MKAVRKLHESKLNNTSTQNNQVTPEVSAEPNQTETLAGSTKRVEYSSKIIDGDGKCDADHDGNHDGNHDADHDDFLAVIARTSLATAMVKESDVWS